MQHLSTTDITITYHRDQLEVSSAVERLLVRTGSRSTHIAYARVLNAFRDPTIYFRIFTPALPTFNTLARPHAIDDTEIFTNTHPPGERTFHSLYSFDEVRSHSLYKSERKKKQNEYAMACKSLLLTSSLVHVMKIHTKICPNSSEFVTCQTLHQ